MRENKEKYGKKEYESKLYSIFLVAVALPVIFAIREMKT